MGWTSDHVYRYNDECRWCLPSLLYWSADLIYHYHSHRRTWFPAWREYVWVNLGCFFFFFWDDKVNQNNVNASDARHTWCDPTKRRVFSRPQNVRVRRFQLSFHVQIVHWVYAFVIVLCMMCVHCIHFVAMTRSRSRLPLKRWCQKAAYPII